MPETTDEKIDRILCELRLMGFATAKQIAEWTGKPAGVMNCPMCRKPLQYSTAPNGHFRAFCEDEDCLRAME